MEKSEGKEKNNINKTVIKNIYFVIITSGKEVLLLGNTIYVNINLLYSVKEDISILNYNGC